MSSERPTKRPRTGTSTSTSTSTESSKATYTGFKRIEKYNKLTLPDGTHRRKLEKIKKSLIQRAKLVKSFKKLKTQTEPELSIGRKRFDELARLADEEEAERRRARQAKTQKAGAEEEEGEEEEWNGVREGDEYFDDVERKNEGESGEGGEGGRYGPTMHPDRISRSSDLGNAEKGQQTNWRKKSQRGTDKDGRALRRRPSRFDKELHEAAKIAAEREKHQQMLAEREAERRHREVEREKWKKAVNAKTRTGQIKLGKQSGLLLDKIKRQMAES